VVCAVEIIIDDDDVDYDVDYDDWASFGSQLQQSQNGSPRFPASMSKSGLACVYCVYLFTFIELY